MKHHPKDVTRQGVKMRECKRCRIRWGVAEEAVRMAEKCPGRNR